MMDDWQPTMRLREVWDKPTQAVVDGEVIANYPAEFLRIECLYRHTHSGEVEWRALPKVEAE